ncbi:MAG: BsuPI-related putative proteinase inhibitor [Chloroherpetonaceae bacterium]|nr:BsuPI-related putative proteinase inhibitor [Chthonomonadaceae bacterium]MDW8207422.1 BsuPI-related putative proteinase inhibitor [Chloroherpetonaceae bacterium]
MSGWRVRGWAGLVALLAVASRVVGAQGEAAEGPAAGDGRDVPVKVTVSTDKKVYRPGEVIRITLNAKNTQPASVTLRFASGQMFDLEIRRGKDRNGERVWQWAEGRMFTMALRSRVLAPGQALTFVENYGSREMERSSPVPVPRLTPGTYTVVGILTTMGRTPKPFGTATFVVR